MLCRICHRILLTSFKKKIDWNIRHLFWWWRVLRRWWTTWGGWGGRTACGSSSARADSSRYPLHAAVQLKVGVAADPPVPGRELPQQLQLLRLRQIQRRLSLPRPTGSTSCESCRSVPHNAGRAGQLETLQPQPGHAPGAQRESDQSAGGAGTHQVRLYCILADLGTR